VERGGEIPPLTVSEQIEDAGNKLKANSGDPAARMALVRMVDSAPDFEASLAAYTLGTRAKGHADIMAALGQQLRIRGGVAKVHMAEAMLRLDGNHATATDALLKLSASEDKRVRMMAAFSMQSATKTQKERCITALIKILKDSDSDVRASAALALGAYGPEAKRAIPAIVTVIHDVDPGTARAAGVALQCVVRNSLDSKAIRPVAAEAVDSK
ncbi:MAG: HEAT repeat domain-containing protein, partial [Planctomycetota bacterium]|nr:HEAT repeat domain-containing protein [Planctomycetota bacterium]